MAQATATKPDVQEMVVVHRMFRREYRLAPVLVRGVAAGDRPRAAVVAAHLRELTVMLHHHHQGEDDLVWPRLHARTPVSAELVHRMERQHVEVGGLLGQLDELLPSWAAEPGLAQRESLAEVLDALAPALETHLDEEEREILPLIEQHLTAAEWDELGERAVAAIPKTRLLVLLGYVLEEASPSERQTMLGVLPPPVRLVYRTVGQRKHRKERDRIRAGTVPVQRQA
jgi:iron-sulfur cluster repair protein YtfE (RIC family)